MKKNTIKKKNSHIPEQQNQRVSDKKAPPDMDTKYNMLFILAIITAGIIAYSNSFECSFHFDDVNIFQLSATKDNASIGEWIHLFPNRPLGIITFAMNYHIHKLDVWGYHLVNLIIHLINAFLVWWLTFLTFSTPVMKANPVSKHKTMIAFLTGLLFVTHPLATQSVTYIVQRFTSLATLFYLLSLILFIKGRLYQGERTMVMLLFGGSVISLICGLLTKEIVITLPFSMLLYEYCFIKVSPWKMEMNKKNVIFVFMIMATFVFFLMKFASLKIFDPVPPNQIYPYSISMKEYLFTQFSVILTYLRLFILPFNQHLDYLYPVSTGLFEIKTLISLLVLLLISIAGVLLFNKYRLISFGIFWFFLTISVESSIIPISQDVIYEHRTYLPAFGFFIAMTGTLFSFVKERYIKTVWVFILMFAAVNILLTYERNNVWNNEYTLWGDSLKKSPGKARVNHNFGLALFEKGEKQGAIYYYDRAIKLHADYADAHNNLGFALSDQGKISESIDYFNKAILLKPNYAEAYNNRGIAYYKMGDYRKAIEDFDKVISLHPAFYKAYINRGNAYDELKNYQQALDNYNEAIRVKSDYLEAYINRAAFYLNRGNRENGCLDAQTACALGNCNLLERARAKGDCRSIPYPLPGR